MTAGRLLGMETTPQPRPPEPSMGKGPYSTWVEAALHLATDYAQNSDDEMDVVRAAEAELAALREERDRLREDVKTLRSDGWRIQQDYLRYAEALRTIAPDPTWMGSIARAALTEHAGSPDAPGISPRVPAERITDFHSVDAGATPVGETHVAGGGGVSDVTCSEAMIPSPVSISAGLPARGALEPGEGLWRCQCCGEPPDGAVHAVAMAATRELRESLMEAEYTASLSVTLADKCRTAEQRAEQAEAEYLRLDESLSAFTKDLADVMEERDSLRSKLEQAEAELARVREAEPKLLALLAATRRLTALAVFRGYVSAVEVMESGLPDAIDACSAILPPQEKPDG